MTESTSPLFISADNDPELIEPALIIDKTEQNTACQRKPYCVLGSGHKGFCARVPKTAADDTPDTEQVVKRGPGRPKGSTNANPARKPSTRKGSGFKPILGLVWGTLGQVLENYGPEPSGPPVGRVMSFQAPYAAGVLDKALTEHVPAYRALDKATGGLLDELGPLIVPPLLVGIRAANESARTTLLPLLAGQLEILAAAVVAEDQRVKETFANMAEVGDDARNMAEAVMGMLFSPRPVYEPDPFTV